MKKISLVLSCLLFAGLFNLSTKFAAADHAAGTVEQREGIYIFLCSKPVAATEYIGSIKKSFAISGAPDEMLNAMVKKCKKEFPTAQAIIFTTAAMDKADCVKFKE